jgi:hypothetical protein
MVDTPYRESTLGAQVHRRIREQLKKQNATEDQLIQALTWPRQRYLMTFIGPKGPTLQTLAVLASTIGCDITDLVVGCVVAPPKGGGA